MIHPLTHDELRPFERTDGEKMTEAHAVGFLRRLPLDEPVKARQMADEILALFLYDAGFPTLGEAWEMASEDLPLTMEEWEEWHEEAY